MTHPSKRKGNSFERSLVNIARESGLTAQRAYASNGESLGHHAEVDLVIADKRIQAKRRKSIASFMQPTENVDAVAIRQDRGETLVVVTLWEYLDLVAESPPPDDEMSEKRERFDGYLDPSLLVKTEGQEGAQQLGRLIRVREVFPNDPNPDEQAATIERLKHENNELARKRYDAEQQRDEARAERDRLAEQVERLTADQNTTSASVASLRGTSCQQPNWDSYGAVPVSGETIDAAERVAERLAGLTIDGREVRVLGPTNSGGIVFSDGDESTWITVETVSKGNR